MSQKLKSTLWGCVVMMVIAQNDAQASMWQRFWGTAEEAEKTVQANPIVTVTEEGEVKNNLQTQTLDFDLSASTLAIGSGFVVLEKEEVDVSFYCSKETFTAIMQEACQHHDDLYIPKTTINGADGDQSIENAPPFKIIKKRNQEDGFLIVETQNQYQRYMDLLAWVAPMRGAYLFNTYDFSQDMIQEMERRSCASYVFAQERLSNGYRVSILNDRYNVLLPLMTQENVYSACLYPFLNGSLFAVMIDKMKQVQLPLDVDDEGMFMAKFEALKFMGQERLQTLSQTLRWILILRASSQEVPHATVQAVPEVYSPETETMSQPLILSSGSVSVTGREPSMDVTLIEQDTHGFVPYVLGFGALVIGTLIISNHK